MVERSYNKIDAEDKKTQLEQAFLTQGLALDEEKQKHKATDKKRKKWKVGFFVLLAATVLAAIPGAYHIGKNSERKNTDNKPEPIVAEGELESQTEHVDFVKGGKFVYETEEAKAKKVVVKDEHEGHIKYTVEEGKPFYQIVKDTYGRYWKEGILANGFHNNVKNIHELKAGQELCLLTEDEVKNFDFNNPEYLNWVKTQNLYWTAPAKKVEKKNVVTPTKTTTGKATTAVQDTATKQKEKEVVSSEVNITNINQTNNNTEINIYGDQNDVVVGNETEERIDGEIEIELDRANTASKDYEDYKKPSKDKPGEEVEDVAPTTDNGEKTSTPKINDGVTPKNWNGNNDVPGGRLIPVDDGNYYVKGNPSAEDTKVVSLGSAQKVADDEALAKYKVTSEIVALIDAHTV